MPPIIALIICTAFVLFLLRLERKQSPDVSFALWIPTIWMLLISGKSLALWFSSGGGDMEAGSPMDRAFLIGIACVGLRIIARRNCDWSKLIKDNVWITITILFMLISISWSDIPYISFKRWIKEIVAIIMCYCVATEKDPYQAFQSIFRRAMYILMPYSLVLIKYYPHLGVIYSKGGVTMWTGVSIHKNSLSRLCILFIFFLLWTFFRRWKGRETIVVWYQTYLELVLLFLIIYIFMGSPHQLTYTATALVALCIAIIAFIGLLMFKKFGIIISASTITLLIGIIIIYGTITPFLGGLTVIDISSTVGRDESLTGRADIWARLIPYVLNKPFLGSGFGGFWTDAMITIVPESHPHNGYLNTILNIGFVGLFFFSMFLIKCGRNAQKEMTKNFDWGVLWLCFLLLTITHNISEASAGSFNYQNIIVLLLLSFVTAAGNADSKKIPM